MSAIVLPQPIADCASSEMSEILARPTRFELVTSAFGGQGTRVSCGLPEFPVDFLGLRI